MENQTPPQIGMQPTKSRKKIVGVMVVAVILIAVIATAVAVWPQKDSDITPAESSQNADSIADSTQAAIEITDEGFSPQTINVAVGTTVTWTNKSTDLRTVSTDPHPAHTQLKDFGGKELLQNETYSYVFKKAGTFTYHDETNPLEIKGTINVQ